MAPERLHVYMVEVYIHAVIALREYEEFRSIMEVPSTRQAPNNRDARNAIEHLDERLDK